MGARINWRLGGRKLATRVAQAELIATVAQKLKLLAKADLRAARKSWKCAKEVAKRERRRARAAKKAGGK
jgi:hypothetical protein